MNITGYSQQNNILGKTISNQKPNMINNPFFNEMLANNNNNNINLNNMNINSMNNINNMNMINQNNMIINQNQNQNKSLSYLNHKNMKINGIFSNTMANNTIKLNPYDNSSKQGNNIISYSQKLKEQKGDISERMNNNFNNNNNNNNIKNPQNNINNNNDQNILNDICNKIVVTNSVYYPYIESEATRYINDLLKNMDSFGEIIKNKIEQEKISSPNKFISISEALSSNFSDELKKKDYYVLSSLKFALESQGCTCEIEREYANSENEKKEFYTAMQFITNGMYKLKKYILTFDFGNEKNNTMLNNIMVQNSFNEKLKFELKKLLNIKSASKNIIIGNPRAGPYIVSAIIKQSNFNELNEIDLLNSLKNNIDFNSIQKVQKTILLNGCKLNRIMLDDLGDNFNNYGQNEKRGGKDYIPPLGWMGYGLRVLNRYDLGNNDWIDYDNNPNEWAVAYHGMGIGLNGDINNNNLQFKKSKDIYHDGKSVGEGVYMTQDPNIMEQYSSEYELQGKKYKLGIMCRIMPKSIRSPENGKEYWVINGTENEVRPYRILIKEIV